jgi:hypothetical protein
VGTGRRAAIAWQLEKLGVAVPPERTIEAILKRAGATRRERPRRRASKGIRYPTPAARVAGDVVQVDLVGPRHLDGGVRFHALNQIDVASHHAGIEIIEDRSDQRVPGALHPLRCRHGVPERVQFDNGGPFVFPTGIGEVVRVCLRQGATPVFMPPREPWRNGGIEHFNDTFDKRFFRQERFAGVEHLSAHADAFERFHNSQHRYSATRGQTPDEAGGETNKPAPIALAELPARVARARTDRVHPLRPLRSQVADSRPRDRDARRQRLPVVTATLDLALTDDEHNLLVSSDQGELLTTGQLPTPAS